MLPASRIDRIGETPQKDERDALRFIEEVLPNSDPLHVWELFHLLDPSTGRLLEIDALVMGYSALYLIELKSGPGVYEGNAVDWYRTPPESPKRWMEPPLRLINLKAKILKSRLQARMEKPYLAPRVEPLVFLSAEQVDLRFEQNGDLGVVTRTTLAKAIQRHQFPGAPESWEGRRIDKPLRLDIARTLKDKLGIRPRKGKQCVGDWELGEVIEEGATFQDRLAQHRGGGSMKMRARVYLVPEQTSVERRQQLRRAADGEAQLLFDVREHPNILQIANYATDAPLGPTVLLHHFDGEPLDAFLRHSPDLTFTDRVEIIKQVGQALAYCHGRQITHGALGPQSVLVRREPGRGLVTKLFNFQLGRGETVTGTLHVTALAAEPWLVYQAPELTEDPTQAGPESDLFSLGALAYFVFTGKPPANGRLDLLTRLARDGHLDPLAVDDGIPIDTGVDNKSLVTLIEDATKRQPVYRGGDVAQWVELLEDLATRPQVPESKPDVSPLLARRDDVVGGDLVVEAVLGQGATSRVLRVKVGSDERRYALKCSLGEDHDPRLSAEAGALRQLHHQHIVRLVDERVLGGRTCLLLTLAGEHTLQKELATEGVVSLDYAMRYGEDLLDALELLEEQAIVHRDIKPANIGVGTATKGKKHLMLFDFSLVAAGRGQLEVGTSAYRDPFLRLRGAWDAAADRWSAAVTLHEMLTGVRPRFAEGKTALDSDAHLEIAAERFDPSVRSRLKEFFDQAFLPQAEQRHASATAMRHAWIAAFGEGAPTVEVPAPSGARTAPHPSTVTLEQLAAMGDDTPIDALPLSARARNALDRAGVLKAAQLPSLPENQLSAVRGVGTGVAREILDFRQRWCEARQLGPKDADPFFGGYRGDDVLVSSTTIPAAAVTVLEDAGLSTLMRLASAPVGQVEALAERHQLDLAVLRRMIEEEHGRAGVREHPTTVEGWVRALMPRKQERARYLELLYGLEAPFAGKTDVRATEVAENLGVTRARVYQVLGDARERWGKHAAMTELRRTVHGLVEAAGGAIPLLLAAEQLVSLLSAEPGAHRDLVAARGAALVKMVAEVEKGEPEGLRAHRLHDRALWLLLGEGLASVLERLGQAADELAGRPVLPSPGEVGRRLSEVSGATLLSRLGPGQLALVAAQASESAACSPRLELYPRKMPAERALDLSSTVLTTPITEEQVAQRVRARYPEADPLPTGEPLRVLLNRHGLEWNDEEQRFVRPGERHRATLHTSFTGPVTHLTTAPTSQPRDMAPDAITARELDEQIDHAIDRRLLRIVGVSVDRAPEAALALRERKGMRVENLDAHLVAAMRLLMAEKGIKASAVHAADRDGPTAKGWRNLRKLAQQAVEQVASKLLPPREGPLLLIQPGLIARYGLDEFLRKMVQVAQSDDSHAIFLLVPSRQQGGLPPINEEMAVPGVLPSQALWISREWLRNLHNAAA